MKKVPNLLIRVNFSSIKLQEIIAANVVVRCCFYQSGNTIRVVAGHPFDLPVNETAIRYETDNTHGMRRVEVMCDNCGSHLGHVFEDGPAQTTGQRFCINSVSLDFEESTGE